VTILSFENEPKKLKRFFSIHNIDRQKALAYWDNDKHKLEPGISAKLDLHQSKSSVAMTKITCFKYHLLFVKSIDKSTLVNTQVFFVT
jgi:hypothetical protein